MAVYGVDEVGVIVDIALGACHERPEPRSDPVLEWVKDGEWTLRDSRTGTVCRRRAPARVPPRPSDYARLGHEDYRERTDFPGSR
ncbi:hypothetical protein GCM10027612_87480 [Microbispora bryophytorum subsp. camponoti]